jgi:hypothetical protein
MEVEWSASLPGRFTPRDRAPATHWIRGWVGPRAGLEAVSMRKIPSPRRQSKHGHPIVHSVASRHTDWATPAPLKDKTLKFYLLFCIDIKICLIVRELYRLRVFENRVLRRIFGPKTEKVAGSWRRLHNEDFIICTLHKILVWVMHIILCWKTWVEDTTWEDLGVDGKIIS